MGFTGIGKNHFVVWLLLQLDPISLGTCWNKIGLSRGRLSPTQTKDGILNDFLVTEKPISIAAAETANESIETDGFCQSLRTVRYSVNPNSAKNTEMLFCHCRLCWALMMACLVTSVVGAVKTECSKRNEKEINPQ